MAAAAARCRSLEPWVLGSQRPATPGKPTSPRTVRTWHICNKDRVECMFPLLHAVQRIARGAVSAHRKKRDGACGWGKSFLLRPRCPSLLPRRFLGPLRAHHPEMRPQRSDTYEIDDTIVLRQCWLEQLYHVCEASAAICYAEK